MLSGVGPKSELQKHGIDQVVELPVGRNLQDHCMVLGATLTIGKPEGQMTTDALELLNPMTLVEYYSKGTGTTDQQRHEHDRGHARPAAAKGERQTTR